MNNKRSYRLGKYRITEYDNLLLSWEKHVAVAEQRSGKCFMSGDVLIIGHCSNQETGYLIGEFHDQIQKLPVWDKTRYYCLASSLLDTATGHSLASDLLNQRLSFVNINSSRLKSAIILEPSTYRLGRYQITITVDGQVCWQTYEGFNRIAGGRCIIESALLFIGFQEYSKEGQSMQEFLDTLNQLPKWDKTMAWGHYDVLHVCREEQQTEKNSDSIWSRSPWSYKSFDETSLVTSQNLYEETCKKSLHLCHKWLKTAWYRLREGKYWFKYIIPLVVAGLLFVFFIISYSAEKILHWLQWVKKRHHKHDD